MCQATCVILVPQPGIEPEPLAVKAWSPNHWTAKAFYFWLVINIMEYSLEGLMLKLKLQYFDAKNWFIWKDPNAGKDWRWKEKGMTEDEMVGWHHWLSGHKFEYTPGDSERQGSLQDAAGHGVAKSQTRLSDWTELSRVTCTIH